MRCVVDQRITPSAKARYLGFCSWGDAFCYAETHPTFNYIRLLNMAKLTQYRQIIQKILTEYRDWAAGSNQVGVVPVCWESDLALTLMWSKCRKIGWMTRDICDPK
jgi:hypothetical protein